MKSYLAKALTGRALGKFLLRPHVLISNFLIGRVKILRFLISLLTVAKVSRFIMKNLLDSTI
jgi:hypothetical protein